MTARWEFSKFVSPVSPKLNSNCPLLSEYENVLMLWGCLWWEVEMRCWTYCPQLSSLLHRGWQMLALWACFVAVSMLKGVIPYLLWQCIQLEGIFEEVASGTAVLQRKVSEKISEVLKCAEHSHNNNKRGWALFLQADIVLVEWKQKEGDAK